MNITLTTKEAEDFFYSALCNGLGQFQAYGGTLEPTAEEYKKARKILQDLKPNDTICFEDIYMQVLRQGSYLEYVDEENDEYNTKVYLKDVHEKVQLTQGMHLIDMQQETDDADTADAILQTVVLGSVVFA